MGDCSVYMPLFKIKSMQGSSCGSVVKNLPPKQETGVQSLGREDPLEKEMTTPSSILAWKIPWTEEPGGLAVHRAAQNWTQLK